MNKSTHYLYVNCKTKTGNYTITAFEKISISKKEQAVLQGSDSYSFIYIKHGSVSFKICGNSVFLSATNLLFLRPGSPCVISSSKSKSEIIRIVFSAENAFSQNNFDSRCTGFFGKYHIFTAGPHNFFPAVFLKLASCFPFDEEGFTKDSTKLLEMTENIIRKEDGIVNHFLLGTKDSIVVAKEYIDNHFTENFTVSYLAEYVRLSESYLSHCFTKKYGESIKQYIIRKRVDFAIFLLENTDKSSAEISKQIGYTSPQKFNNMFKKTTGKTPMFYRKKERDV